MSGIIEKILVAKLPQTLALPAAPDVHGEDGPVAVADMATTCWTSAAQKKNEHTWSLTSRLGGDKG